MGPWGALIMSFFGAGFFTWANVLAIGWRSPVLAVGPVVFIALAALAGSKIRRSADGAYAPSRKAGQIISWASAAEGVGIPIVALTLANTGHADATLPGIALVVGLHFIPMAWAIPFKPFFACAALLVCAAIVGFTLRQPVGSSVSGYVAAITLWGASIAAINRKPVAG